MANQLPNLSKLSAQLAEDNRRIAGFVDSMAMKIDILVAASLEKDWNEVRRVCEYVSTSGVVYGYPQIASHARDVCTHMDQLEGGFKMKRSMLRLISAYGKMDRPIIESEVAVD